MFAEPELREDGAILVPRRVTGNNGIIGDAIEAIHPDHPEYQKWLDYLRGPEDDDNNGRPEWAARAARRMGR